MENTIIKEDVANSRLMRDNLFKSYTQFIDNKNGTNGGKKQFIDLDLIAAEIKYVETYGKEMMRDIHAGNLMHKAISSKNKAIEDKVEKIA